MTIKRRPLILPAKRSKYGNRRVTVDGITYASAKEARRAGELAFLERAGAISRLRRQVRYPLIVNGILVTTYISDSSYLDMRTMEEVIEDVKSPITRKNPVYVLKRKLMLALLGLTIRET